MTIPCGLAPFTATVSGRLVVLADRRPPQAASGLSLATLAMTFFFFVIVVVFFSVFGGGFGPCPRLEAGWLRMAWSDGAPPT